MDKLIYTAFNTVNNIYDNRAVRAQNLANIPVPGYKRDLGAKSVGTAFLDNMQTFSHALWLFRTTIIISAPSLAR